MCNIVIRSTMVRKDEMLEVSRLFIMNRLGVQRDKGLHVDVGLGLTACVLSVCWLVVC